MFTCCTYLLTYLLQFWMTFLHFFYFLHCFNLFSGIIIFVYEFFIFCFPQSFCFLLKFVSIPTAYDALLLLCTFSIAISSVLLLSVCLLESLSLLFPLIYKLFIFVSNTCSLFSPSTLCLFRNFFFDLQNRISLLRHFVFICLMLCVVFIYF